MTKPTQNLRSLIQSYRIARGLSFEALAQETLCTSTELKGFEHGLFSIGTNQLYSLVQALGIRPEELYAVLGEQAVSTLHQESIFASAQSEAPAKPTTWSAAPAAAVTLSLPSKSDRK